MEGKESLSWTVHKETSELTKRMIRKKGDEEKEMFFGKGPERT